MNTQTLPFEIKSVTDNGVIEGVISAFGGVDSYGDTIERGAYTKSLEALRQSGRKLPLLYQHDHARPIGVWEELRQTDTALFGRAQLAMGVKDAAEAHQLARLGALTGISIGYEIAEKGSRHEGSRRILSDIRLWEASLVTFPADQSARISAVKAIGGPGDIEAVLRECGLSGRKAKFAACAAWDAIKTNTDAAAEEEARAILNASAARIAAIGGIK